MKKSVRSRFLVWVMIATVLFSMIPAGLTAAEETNPAAVNGVMPAGAVTSTPAAISVPSLTSVTSPSAANVVFDEDCSDLSALAGKGWKVSNPKPSIYVTDSKNTMGNPEGVITQTVPDSQIMFYADESAPRDDSGVSYIKLIDKQNLLKDRLTGEGKWFVEFSAKFDSLMKISGTYIGDSGFSTFIDTGAKVYRITFSPDNKIIVRNGVAGKYSIKPADLHIGDGKFHTWGISCHGGGVMSIVCDGKQVAFFTDIDVQSVMGQTSWGDYGIQFISASLYGAAAGAGANKVYFDSMKFILNETAAGAIGDENLILRDDCSKLTGEGGAGWTVTSPMTGTYITDSANSVDNPNNIQMPVVPAGQYMLYGDGTVVPNNFTKMEKAASIGSGAWELRFDARFKDLITPAANNVYRGVSFEIFANNLEYKITFNDKDKILAMTNSTSGAYTSRQVAMPADDKLHNWSIVYNGHDKVYVKMDNQVMASFQGIGLATALQDKVVLLNASLNWAKGTNEVYIDNIIMNRIDSFVEEPNVLFNDDCTSLNDAGWSKNGTPQSATYMADSMNSFGTPGVRTVEAGKYLLYGDKTATKYMWAQKNLNIGTGAWALEFHARIIGTTTPDPKVAGILGSRGMIFDIYAGGKEYKIIYNSGNKIYAMTSAAQVLEVDMPDSSTYHKWGIAYNGTGKVFISIDGQMVGSFKDIGASATLPDQIRIMNLPLNVVGGTNEVYFDNIKMTKNIVPEWAKYDPKINKCIIMPESDSTHVDLVVSANDFDPEWVKQDDVTIQAALYNKDNVKIGDTVTGKLNGQPLPLTLNPNGTSGIMKVVVRLMKGITKIDEITKNIELDASVITAVPGQTITAEGDKVYLFEQVGDMKDDSGRDALSAGWRKAAYSYEGTARTGTVVENAGDTGWLNVPLKANGWFGVYVGYVNGTEEFRVANGSTEKTVVVERLDPYNPPPAVEQYGSKMISETFAAAALFNDNSIKINQSNNRKVRIAYIKFRSLTPEEIELYNRANEGAEGKRAVYNNDGYSDFYMGYYTDVNKLKELAVDRYAGQDVGEMDWCLGTTLMLNYNSQYAGIPYQDLTPEQDKNLMRDGDRVARDRILGFINAGVNPGAVVAQRADELGISTNITLRMSAFYDPAVYPWLNGSTYSNFVNATTDYRYVNKDGSKQNRLSYAYPQFREIVKSIIKEAAAFPGVDGVNLDFCRYADVMGYEPIMKDAFKAATGLDATSTVATTVTKWNQFRADVMTGFMRELRSELAGKKLSVRVPYSGYLAYGLDIQKWVSEGLIDVLIPSVVGTEDFFNIAPFISMVNGTNVKLYGGITADLGGHDLTRQEEDMIKMGIPVVRNNKYLSTQQYRLRARELYNAGCEKVYIFNSWKGQQSLGVIGDKVELDKWYGLAYTAEWVGNPVTVTAPVSEYLCGIKAGSDAVKDFAYDREDYTVIVSPSAITVPEVTVCPVDPKASVQITNSQELNGTTVINVTSSDGSKAKTYRVTFKVDNVPPVSEMLVEGTDRNGWYKSDLIVSIKASDELIGVDKSFYRYGSTGEWLTYNAPFPVSAEGITKIQIYSADKFGNAENVSEHIVKLDKTPAAFSMIVNGNALKEGASFEDCMPLTFKVSDNLSGIAAAKVVIDGKEYVVDTKKSSVDIDMAGKVGSRTASVVIEDVAGNRTEKSFSFNVTTSVKSMKTLIEQYTKSGDLKLIMKLPLTTKLDQAQHQLDKGSKTQAVKHLQDFLKHLNSKLLACNVSAKAKEALNNDANALIALLNKK